MNFKRLDFVGTPHPGKRKVPYQTSPKQDGLVQKSVEVSYKRTYHIGQNLPLTWKLAADGR